MTTERALMGGEALIVESDPRTARYIEETLDRLGLKPTVVRSVAEAGAQLPRVLPDLLVLSPVATDLGDHLTLVEAARRRCGSGSVLILDRYSPVVGEQIQAAGVDGVLLKPVHRAQLEVTCYLAVARRGRRPEPAQSPADAPAARTPDLNGGLVAAGVTFVARRSMDRMTPRERQVVALLLQHRRVPAIAASLGISQQTVRNHLKSVFRRTGTHSQQELLDRLSARGDERSREDGNGQAPMTGAGWDLPTSPAPRAGHPAER